MNKQDKMNQLEATATKIEDVLSEVQKVYYKYEAQRQVPERYERAGLDNLVGNAGFYDILAAYKFKGVEAAKKEVDITLSNLEDIFGMADAYKPSFAGCSWHGFSADIYYPLHKAIAMIKNEFIPQQTSE